MEGLWRLRDENRPWYVEQLKMTDELDSLGNLFSDSNGTAYEKTQNRTGPPLEYVGEKLRRSLLCLHDLSSEICAARGANKTPADSSTQPQPAGVPPVAPLLYAAFYYALVAYLALHNMLALANPPSFSESPAPMSREEFDEWLDGIDREGSVT